VNANRATAVVFLLLAAILGVLRLRSSGPAPLPTTAPATQFSAARAMNSLRQILGGDVPHPVGSAAHDVVRDRVAAAFRSLGYQTSMQQRFTCNAYAVCAPVANILARLPADARADTLVVAAHYDSVGAGPGASDDGIGVGTLVETARAIRNERFRNSILFLITDGEELGLLGAEAFVADADASRAVAAVINVDNRGSSGRSYLFETSRKNRWLLPIIQRALPWPATSSLYYDIYEILPNDTDMTVFKRAGFGGVNFGNIGNVGHYHTPLDNLAHVSPSTVQDHGDHILAMTRALGDSDLRRSAPHNAVYFDVLSLFIVWWPQPWTAWMAAGALLVLLAAAAIRLRDGATTSPAITVGVVSFLASMVVMLVLAAAATWIATFRAGGAVWFPQPGPSISAMWLIGFAVPIAIASLLRRWIGFDALFIGSAICWCAIAVALTIVLPGGSYIAVLTSIAFAAVATVRAATGRGEAGGPIACAAVSALLIFPLALAFYDAIGNPSLPLVAFLAALVGTTIAPLVSAASVRGAIVSAMLVTAAACVVMQLLIPAHTPEWPRDINVRYVDDNGRAFWETDAPISSVHTPATAYEWLHRAPHVFRSSTPRMAMAPPNLRVLGDESATQRRIKLRIRSDRGAPRIALYFRAPSFQRLLVNGSPLPPRTPKFQEFLASGWHRVSVRGATEAEIEITLSGNEPIEAIVVDASPGLPPEGAAIVAARDASVAVPANDGDTTTVMRRVRIGSPAALPRAWSVGLITMGGYAGRVRSRFIRSDSAPACRREVETAVAAAHPETWRKGYFLPTESGRTDQFHYSLTLQMTRSDGKTATYEVGWQDDSFEMLPDDVRDLYETMSSLHASECSPMPGGSPR
jgi:hypothetical protein